MDQQKIALLEEKLDTEQQLDIAELGLKREELQLKTQAELGKAAADRAKFDASQELEGIKLGREIAKDEDSE